MRHIVNIIVYNCLVEGAYIICKIKWIRIKKICQLQKSSNPPTMPSITHQLSNYPSLTDSAKQILGTISWTKVRVHGTSIVDTLV